MGGLVQGKYLGVGALAKMAVLNANSWTLGATRDQGAVFKRNKTEGNSKLYFPTEEPPPRVIAVGVDGAEDMTKKVGDSYKNAKLGKRYVGAYSLAIPNNKNRLIISPRCQNAKKGLPFCVA